MLTVYGIETKKQDLFLPVYRMVATVFTACGIETLKKNLLRRIGMRLVATVLTACGIETTLKRYRCKVANRRCNSTYCLRY